MNWESFIGGFVGSVVVLIPVGLLIHGRIRRAIDDAVSGCAKSDDLHQYAVKDHINMSLNAMRAEYHQMEGHKRTSDYYNALMGPTPSKDPSIIKADRMMMNAERYSEEFMSATRKKLDEEAAEKAGGEVVLVREFWWPLMGGNVDHHLVREYRAIKGIQDANS